MFVIIGYIIVFSSVIGGFLLAGGHVAALIQPAEFIIIVGAAVGAFITAHGGAPMKAIFAAIPGAFKASRYNKALYMELFALLYELLSKVRKEGLMSIEADVDDPQNSPIFSLRSSSTGYCERHTMTSGCIPILLSSFTLCCVGLVFSSPDAAM